MLFGKLSHISDILLFLEDDLKRLCLEQQWQISGDQVFIANQEEHIKSKNITEKITFESKITDMLS